MAMWSPWRGCHKHSSGCDYCYIHKGDSRRGVNTSDIVRTDNFYAPIAKLASGAYKMKSGQLVYLCFQTDFLIAEADDWRAECWAMIRERSDLRFLFLTKRIDRLEQCVPDDWGDGYDNVIVGCTVENQEAVDYRLDIFSKLAICHKNIICQPLIEAVDISRYLDDIELVVVGGESDKNARVLDYQWVLSIREQCRGKNISFEFRQCGSNFIKDGKKYTLKTKDLCSLARKADINYNK